MRQSRVTGPAVGQPLSFLNQWGNEMKKLLIVAGAVSALALTSAPAFAATPTTQATATARIVQPLTITSVRDLDLGTIVLSGTAPYTDTIGITRAGAFTCGANTTCSGTTKTARYTMTGTRDQKVSISVSSTIDLTNQTQTSSPLTLTVDAPAVALLDATGNGGFNLGGSIQVTDATVDGVYTGTFDVTADYQ
jgi:hypothetical protein